MSRWMWWHSLRRDEAPLVDRARELGVFDDPEIHSDQELRDAIAAEEAAIKWLDRLEKLPTDKAKRDAIHRLSTDLDLLRGDL